MFQGAFSLEPDAGERRFISMRRRDMLSPASSGRFGLVRCPHPGLMVPRPGSLAWIARHAGPSGMDRHSGLWNAQTDALQKIEAMKGEMPCVFENFSF